MSIVRPVDPDELCDRCDHPLKFHAPPELESVCMIAGAKVYPTIALHKRPRATKCWCDGYVPSGVSR